MSEPDLLRLAQAIISLTPVEVKMLRELLQGMGGDPLGVREPVAPGGPLLEDGIELELPEEQNWPD